jgi:L-asparaginase II
VYQRTEFDPHPLSDRNSRPAPPAPPAYAESEPVLAELVRSGFVEGRHRGRLVALGPDGSVSFASGAVEEPIYPRSVNKPMQAAGIVRAGLRIDGSLLALTAASHSGEQFHLDAVRRILSRAGLPESALQAPPSLPLDESRRHEYLRAGGQAAPIVADCSGKHAAMLATCLLRGWPTDTYLAADHPLQLEIRSTVEDLAGEPVAATGVDGCGAPLFALSLVGLARAFRALATGPEGSAERRVADAMRAHPEYVGGTGRSETLLMSEIPGLIAKPGAEAVYAVGLADGSAIALKVSDGNQRACAPVLVAALRRLGVDAPVLDRLADVPLLGGGRRVGEIRACG